MQIFFVGILCFAVSLNAAQHNKNNVMDEENAKKINFFQPSYAVNCLSEYGIDYTNFDVLDIGCGNGTVARLIAEKANSVIGIDSSEEVILEVCESRNVQNLKFIRSLGEFYKSDQPFDLITSFFCLHWIKDLEITFKNIYSNLKSGGIFLGTIILNTDQYPITLQAFKKTIPWLKKTFPYFTNIDISEATGCFIVDEDILLKMIQTIGFEMVSSKRKTLTTIFKNKEHIISSLFPYVMNNPIVQDMSKGHQEIFFNRYVQEFTSLLPVTEDGGYSFSGSDTVLYLRKK
jgi:ubiquinone/menaquinone biosynthesis C-methylase UbiE